MKIRGLIVKEPFVAMIARGVKKWELRRYPTKIRGPVALVSRGWLYGFAVLNRVFSISLKDVYKYKNMHRAPRRLIENYAMGLDKLYVWEFRESMPLPRPIKVSYSRKARVWAMIDAETVLRKLKREGLSGEAKKLYRMLKKNRQRPG